MTRPHPQDAAQAGPSAGKRKSGGRGAAAPGGLSGASSAQILKVLWAAMTAMTKDVHAPQDVLSAEDWIVADAIQGALEGVLEAMGTKS